MLTNQAEGGRTSPPPLSEKGQGRAGSPSSSQPTSRGLCATPRGTEDTRAIRPTTGLPSSPDQWKRGQFLQCRASPHKCISNPPVRTHPQQVLLAVQLFGVAAWPRGPLGPLTAAQGSAAPPRLVLVHRWEHRRASRAQLVTLPRAVPYKG